MLKQTALIGAATTLLALAACSPSGDTAANDQAPETAAGETFETEATDTLAADEAPPEPTSVIVFESDIIQPNTDGSIPGNAIFGGVFDASDGVAPLAQISDNSADSFAYYAAINKTLDAGTYTLSIAASQPIDRAEAMMVRVQSDEGEAPQRSDLTVTPSGEVVRNRGSFVDVDVQSDAVGATQVISASFTVAEADAGEYRVLIYPSIGRGAELDTFATGTIGLGQITLTKAE